MSTTTRRTNSQLLQTNQSFVTTDDIKEQRRNIFPVNSQDSICLIVSSCFFLIPGCYAFNNSLHFYGIVSFVTTAISINYWRHAVEGWRRTADLWTAKISFAVYFVTGCCFLRDLQVLAFGIPGCVLILVCYYLSSQHWEKDSWMWVYFHMLFHLFVALVKFLVLSPVGL